MKATTQADKALLKEERLAAKAEKRAAKQKQLSTLTQKGAGEQPPGFWRNPPSFLFYTWYSPLLRLVRLLIVPTLSAHPCVHCIFNCKHLLIK